MERINDIRKVKQKLRQKYRFIHKNMNVNEKSKFDAQITDRLIRLSEYKNAKIVLCFVSTPIEVDTGDIIQHAFSDGKIVAVPKCLDRHGNMDFFIINSIDELIKGEFSLMEPDIQKAERLLEYKDSICILPAFSFDAQGYRLGFGMGYYDRFLRRYIGTKIGVCYNSCIALKLPRGRFDKAADYIVTQKYVITVNKDFQKIKENQYDR